MNVTTIMKKISRPGVPAIDETRPSLVGRRGLESEWKWESAEVFSGGIAELPRSRPDF
jgi:hypothetical protein